MNISIKKAIMKLAAGAMLCTALACVSACGGNAEKNKFISVDDMLFSTVGNENTYTFMGIKEGATGTELVIPAKYKGTSVSRVMQLSENENTTLERVTISNGIEMVLQTAFENCKSLERITISESVWSFEAILWRNQSLKAIVVSPGNDYYQSIDGNLYTKDGETLLNYAIGKEASAFSIPDKVKKIGLGAFYNAKALQKIVTSDNLQEIGNSAFGDCTALSDVQIGKNVKVIGSGAFSGCTALREIALPKELDTLGSSAFSKCTSLQYIELPLVEKIETYAFSYCTALERVTMEDGTTKVGANAFLKCEALKEIVWADTISLIEDKAFYGCKKLEKVEMPSWLVTMGRNVFGDCDSLRSIEVDEANYFYMTIDGNVYTSDGKTLVQYAVGKSETDFVLPNGVEKIETSAFDGCSNLQSITLSESLFAIGDDVFLGCDSLTQATFLNMSGWQKPRYAARPQEIYASILQDKAKAADVLKEGDAIQRIIVVEG